jgi:hypothetical protein
MAIFVVALTGVIAVLVLMLVLLLLTLLPPMRRCRCGQSNFRVWLRHAQQRGSLLTG